MPDDAALSPLPGAYPVEVTLPPFQFGQLCHELKAAFDKDAEFVLETAGNAGTLWVKSSKVDVQAIHDAIAKHKPVKHWNWTKEMKAQHDARVKLRRGETLTPKQNEKAMLAVMETVAGRLPDCDCDKE